MEGVKKKKIDTFGVRSIQKLTTSEKKITTGSLTATPAYTITQIHKRSKRTLGTGEIPIM